MKPKLLLHLGVQLAKLVGTINMDTSDFLDNSGESEEWVLLQNVASHNVYVT